MKVFRLGLVTLALASCGIEKNSSSKTREAWDDKNAPVRVNLRYTPLFTNLPMRGRVAERFRPWSDSYWPSRRAGIASRWMNPVGTEDFKYTPPTEEDVKKMDRKALMALSPAEKYDIFMGRFDYPTVNEERKRTHPDAEPWEGLCHGWAAAAILYPEPTQVDVVGANGIKVPFGSADVKALLTYYQGYIKTNKGKRQLGARCNANLSEYPEEGTLAECKDTNAGAFHIVLANELGLYGKSFIMDVSRDFEVWNQPLISYESELVAEQGPSPGAAEGTVQEVVLKTKVRWAVENISRWEPVIGASFQSEEVREYNYRLELDNNGRILGGEWLQDDRPDFLWLPKSIAFEGYWTGVEKIYKSVR